MVYSIIIPTCNRNDLLKKCLDLLHPDVQNFPIDKYEIIVSDDSKDNIAREFIVNNYTWVKWVSGPKKGPAANRNNGAKQAKGKWLIFLDDDIVPDSNILNTYWTAILDNLEIKAFEGAIFPDNWKLLKKDMAECPINTKGNCFWSANIMVEKQLFYEIGGFDTDFKMAAQEDQMLFVNLKNKTKTLFLNTAMVTHPVRFVSFRYKLKNNKRSFYNWLIFKNKQGFTCKQILQQGYISQLKSLSKNIISLKFKQCLLNLDMIFFQLPRIILIKNEEKN